MRKRKQKVSREQNEIEGLKKDAKEEFNKAKEQLKALQQNKENNPEAYKEGIKMFSEARTLLTQANNAEAEVRADKLSALDEIGGFGSGFSDNSGNASSAQEKIMGAIEKIMDIVMDMRNMVEPPKIPKAFADAAERVQGAVKEADANAEQERQADLDAGKTTPQG